MLTHDLDFSTILAATGGTKPSVMQIRSENLNPDVVGEKIVSALWQMQVQLEAGALVSVEPHRTRMRLCHFSSAAWLEVKGSPWTSSSGQSSLVAPVGASAEDEWDKSPRISFLSRQFEGYTDHHREKALEKWGFHPKTFG